LSHIRALERLFARLRIPVDNHEDRIDLLISSLQDPAALRFEKEMGRQPGMCNTWLGIKALFMSVFARPEDKEELEERLDRLERKKGQSVRDLCTEVLQLYDDLDGAVTANTAVRRLLHALRSTDLFSVRLARAERMKNPNVTLQEIVNILTQVGETHLVGDAGSASGDGPTPMELGNIEARGVVSSGSGSSLTALIAEQVASQLAKLDVSGGRGHGLSSMGSRANDSAYGSDAPRDATSSRLYAVEHDRRGRDSHGVYDGYDGNQFGGPYGGYHDDYNQVAWNDPRRNRSWPSQLHRSDEEMDALYAAGRCFCCEQRGHPWFKCPVYVLKPGRK
jgi:hypothetical protein